MRYDQHVATVKSICGILEAQELSSSKYLHQMFPVRGQQ